MTQVGSKGWWGPAPGRRGSKQATEFLLRIRGILNFTPSPKYWSLRQMPSQSRQWKEIQIPQTRVPALPKGIHIHEG